MIPDKSGDLLVWAKTKPNPLDEGLIKDKKNRNDYFERVSLRPTESTKPEKLLIALFAPSPLISLVRHKLRRSDINRKVERVIVAVSNAGDLFIITDTVPVVPAASPSPISQFLSFGGNLRGGESPGDVSADGSGLDNESGIIASDEDDLV